MDLQKSQCNHNHASLAKRIRAYHTKHPKLLAWIVWPLTGLILLMFSLLSVFMYRAERHSDIVHTTDHNVRDGLILIGQMSAIDVYRQEFVLDWFYEGSGNFSANYPVSMEGYLNVNALVFYNGRPDPAGTYIASHESYFVPQTFQTNHRTASAINRMEGVSSVNYPFDNYSVNVSFAGVGLLANSNESLPIKDVRLAYPLQGWTFSQATTVAPYVLPNGDTVQGMVLLLTVRRSGIVKIFVMLLVALSWIISLVILWITIRCKIFGKPFWGSLLGTFSSVLFALPALRNTMPASPTFGTYSDVYGFLINEVIVGMCLVIMMIYHNEQVKKPAPPLPAPTPVPIDTTMPPQSDTMPVQPPQVPYQPAPMPFQSPQVPYPTHRMSFASPQVPFSPQMAFASPHMHMQSPRPHFQTFSPRASVDTIGNDFAGYQLEKEDMYGRRRASDESEKTV